MTVLSAAASHSHLKWESARSQNPNADSCFRRNDIPSNDEIQLSARFKTRGFIDT